jgi:hypothetical protein
MHNKALNKKKNTAEKRQQRVQRGAKRQGVTAVLQ